MRITYNQLATLIACMSPEQRECDVTIEDADDECFAASIRIVDTKDKQDGVLDEGHPLLFIPESDKRATQYDVDIAINQIVGERVKKLSLGKSDGLPRV